MQEELKQFGLTDNEIKVYMSLIKLGDTPVGPIIHDLKIHRQSVYNALEALEKKNMVAKSNKNSINFYQITDPNIIYENLEKQELLIKRLSKTINEELKRSRHEQEINIYDGREKLRQFYLIKYKAMPENSPVLAMFATGKKYEDSVGLDFLKKMEKLRNNKNLTTIHITSEELRKDIVGMVGRLNVPTDRKIRFLPYNFVNPVTTMIWHKSIAFQIFGDFPFIIDIINDTLHKTFTEHFWTLWKIAKE